MPIENRLYQTYIARHAKDSITFFTPTYNRAKYLPRVYESLLQQTSSNFVWIVINDGSTDETDEIMQGIVDENKIPILYIKKNNGGKHSAFKIALEKCRTEYFQCMDDDDIYSSKSVETYLKMWKDINSELKSNIAAIRTLSQSSDGNIVSSGPFPFKNDNSDFIDASTLEMNYEFHVHQENWTCYRTSALKSIELFPTNYWLCDQHTFFSESIWQGRFARKYKCRYYNIVLREYRDDAEYSIIRAKKGRQHYLNMFINSKMILDEQYDYIKKSSVCLLKNVLLINFLRKYLGIKASDLIANTNSNKIRALYYLTMPIAQLGKIVVNRRNI